MRYWAYGHVIESAIDLPALKIAPAHAASFSVTAARQGVTPGPRRPAHAHARTGANRLRITIDEDGYCLRFVDGVDFRVSADGRRVTACRTSASLDVVRRLLIAHVAPLVLSHLGSFVLHASAFGTETGAVALAGASGAGKSTLSAYCGLHGAPIVSDDVLAAEWVEEVFTASPAGVGLSLRPDTLAALGRLPASGARAADGVGKRRLDAADGLAFVSGPLAIRRLYVLEATETSRIEVTPLSVRDAALALVSQSFVLDATDRERLRAQFARACAVAARLPCRRLTFPRSFDLLPRVREAILADA